VKVTTGPYQGDEAETVEPVIMWPEAVGEDASAREPQSHESPPRRQVKFGARAGLDTGIIRAEHGAFIMLPCVVPPRRPGDSQSKPRRGRGPICADLATTWSSYHSEWDATA
jgi:hypothetical protein